MRCFCLGFCHELIFKLTCLSYIICDGNSFCRLWRKFIEFSNYHTHLAPSRWIKFIFFPLSVSVFLKSNIWIALQYWMCGCLDCESSNTWITKFAKLSSCWCSSWVSPFAIFERVWMAYAHCMANRPWLWTPVLLIATTPDSFE